MGLFGRSQQTRERVKEVATLAQACDKKHFSELGFGNKPGSEGYWRKLWKDKPQGPWNLLFLAQNLGTLAQLTHKRKLKLRTFGALFEVGSSALARTEDDSFEVLAADVLGVLYRAQLVIFNPDDSLIDSELVRKAEQNAWTMARKHSTARGFAYGLARQDLLKELMENPLTDPFSNERSNLKAERATAFHGLLTAARAGLERLRGAYASKEAQGNLVDICVRVAQKIEGQQIFQYRPLQSHVGRAVTIAAAALVAQGDDGVAGPTAAFLNGPQPAASHPRATAYWDHHHRLLEANPSHVLPGKSPRGGPSDLNLAPKHVIGGKEDIYHATNEYDEPVRVFIDRKGPKTKKTAPPPTRPVWDGDLSELAVLEARNKEAFRKQLNERGILLMAQASGLIREPKQVQFKDAVGHPLVHMVTIETRREQMATPVETLTEEQKMQGVIANATSLRGRFYEGGKEYNLKDHAERSCLPPAGNEARRRSFDVRRLALQYCRSELEKQIFVEAAENVLSENNDSMIGARSDDGR